MTSYQHRPLIPHHHHHHSTPSDPIHRSSSRPLPKSGLTRSQSLRAQLSVQTDRMDVDHLDIESSSEESNRFKRSRTRRRSPSQVYGLGLGSESGSGLGSTEYNWTADPIKQTFFPPFEDGASNLKTTSTREKEIASNRSGTGQTSLLPRSSSSRSSSPTIFPSSSLDLSTSSSPSLQKFPNKSQKDIQNQTQNQPLIQFTKTHRRARTSPNTHTQTHTLHPQYDSDHRLALQSLPLPLAGIQINGNLIGSESEDGGEKKRGLKLVMGLMGKVISESLNGEDGGRVVQEPKARSPKRKALSADLRPSIGERLFSSFSPVPSPSSSSSPSTILGPFALSREIARAGVHSKSPSSSTSSIHNAQNGPARKRPRPPPLRDLPPPSWSSPGPSPPLTALSPPFSTDLFIFPYPNPITQTPPQPLGAGGFFEQDILGMVSPPRSPRMENQSRESYEEAVAEEEEEDDSMGVIERSSLGLDGNPEARTRRRSSMSSMSSAARTIRPFDPEGELTPRPSRVQLTTAAAEREREMGVEISRRGLGDERGFRDGGLIRGSVSARGRDRARREKESKDGAEAMIRSQSRSRNRAERGGCASAQGQEEGWIRSMEVVVEPAGGGSGPEMVGQGWWGWLGAGGAVKDNAASGI